VKTVSDKPIRYELNTHQHGDHTGGKEVRTRHLGRGHTNGDSVIYFPSERVLHTGDLFVNGQAPFIDYSARTAASRGTRLSRRRFSTTSMP
jgi:glyoxylase-like metal-dependent hydrolase (beta-lactamase superfamily II)